MHEKHIAVIGAGLMGHALALVYALGGHKVCITDSNLETLAGSKALMISALDLLSEGGEVAASWNHGKLSQSVTWCKTLEETLPGVDLVVEAISESLDAKRALYEKLDPLLNEDCVLASNTSGLDVFPVVPASLQKRTLMMHWYSPPYLCDLVDIAGGPYTDPKLVEEMVALVKSLGKEPVVFKKFVPGYVANRIQAAIRLEVFDLLDKGLVTPEDVDRSVIHGLALRIPILGVLAKSDFSGLPLVQKITANKSYTPPELKGNCTSLDRLLAEGNSGVSSGKGFFDWGEKNPEELFRERNKKLLKLKKTLREIKPMLGHQTD